MYNIIIYEGDTTTSKNYLLTPEPSSKPTVKDQLIFP